MSRSRPFSRASGANSTSSRCSNSSMRKSANSGFIAPVSSREMSKQRGEDFFDRFERGVDVLPPDRHRRSPLLWRCRSIRLVT